MMFLKAQKKVEFIYLHRVKFLKTVMKKGRETWQCWKVLNGTN